MLESILDALLRARNPDGGWGAVPGRRSNTEATALGVLALESVRDRALGRVTQDGTTWLLGRQQPDGSWPYGESLPGGSWTTALALLALTGAGERHHEPALRGARWLLGTQGKTPLLFSVLHRVWPSLLPIRLNPDLKGWPWADGTFSWVEPTSWSLIVLKRLRPLLDGGAAGERIREGEAMLYDRMCQGGGWNYGNTSVLGEELPPYPDTTALALISLGDRAEDGANRQSLDMLRKMLAGMDSGFTLALGVICLLLYGQEPTEWRRALARSYERTGFLGVNRTLALSVLALTEGQARLRV